MKKGFVGLPIIFMLTIAFCSGGAAYLVAHDLTDTTIVAPISDFGNFGGEEEETDESEVLSVISRADSNNFQENSFEYQPESLALRKGDLSGTEPLTPHLGFHGDPVDSSEVKLESVDPSSGQAGDLISLKGSGFGSDFGAVYFKPSIDDSCCATLADFWSDTEIKVRVVASGIKGKISIAVETAEGKTSNYRDFEVTSGLPVIEKVEPEEVTAGQFVAIYGKEFGSDLGQVNFYQSTGEFAGECIFGAGYVWNNSQISCIVPDEFLAGDYNIEVVTSDLRESDIKQVLVN